MAAPLFLLEILAQLTGQKLRKAGLCPDTFTEIATCADEHE